MLHYNVCKEIAQSFPIVGCDVTTELNDLVCGLKFDSKFSNDSYMQLPLIPSNGMVDKCVMVATDEFGDCLKDN